MHPIKRTIFGGLLMVCLSQATAQVGPGPSQVKTLNGTGAGTAYEVGQVSFDAKGDRYEVGSFKGSFDFDPGPGVARLTSQGDWDIFLAKYDEKGNHLWARSIGGRKNDMGSGMAIGKDGDVFMTGWFKDTVEWVSGSVKERLVSAGETDLLLARFSGSGDILWAKGMGGPDGDFSSSLAMDVDGRLFLTGSFEGEADFDPGEGSILLNSGTMNAFMARYDPSGRCLWAKAIGGKGRTMSNCMALDGKGHLYVAGLFSGTSDLDPGPGLESHKGFGVMDVFIAKYDTACNHVWSTCLRGQETYNMLYGKALALDGKGGVYLAGDFSGKSKVSHHGGVTALTGNGMEPSNGCFLVKYDEDGRYVWGRGLTGKAEISVQSIAIDGRDLIHITGPFKDEFQFIPTPFLTQVKSAGGFDVFLASYRTNGVALAVSWMGGPADDSGDALALDGKGLLHLSGRFEGSAVFGRGPRTIRVSNPGKGTTGFMAVFPPDSIPDTWK